MFYSESICEDPKNVAFLIEDKEQTFRYYGHIANGGGLNGPNSGKGWWTGRHILEFADGGKYEFSADSPLLIIDNLITGQMNVYYSGHYFLTDVINNIEADILYNPHNDNSYK
jgi:hypothetical protein